MDTISVQLGYPDKKNQNYGIPCLTQIRRCEPPLCMYVCMVYRMYCSLFFLSYLCFLVTRFDSSFKKMPPWPFPAPPLHSPVPRPKHPPSFPRTQPGPPASRQPWRCGLSAARIRPLSLRQPFASGTDEVLVQRKRYGCNHMHALHTCCFRIYVALPSSSSCPLLIFSSWALTLASASSSSLWYEASSLRRRLTAPVAMVRGAGGGMSELVFLEIKEGCSKS